MFYYIIILLIFIIILFILIKKYKKVEPFEKKYAICIWGQLRAVNTINAFYENIANPLNADVFLVIQKTNTENDENINLYNTDKKIMYDNPDNIKDKYNSFEYNEEIDGNFADNRHLKILYNLLKIHEEYGDIFEKNYEYIILTRSDYLHLFKFPDIIDLSHMNNIFWCYDGHEYGGINNTLICVPSSYIKDYLFSCYNNINTNIENLKNKNMCIEEYFKTIFDEKKWKIGKMDNNAFLSANSSNEITTTIQPLYSEKYDVYYKYEYQLNSSYDNLEKYKNGGHWKYIIKDDTPFLIIE
jgi:hypothetical protein